MDRAAILTRQFDAKLVVVHVLEQSDRLRAVRRKRFSQSFHPNAELIETARRQLCDDLRGMGDQIAIRIEEGDPPPAILEVAKAQGCDFIVTGVARNETFGRLTLGKTVDRLLRSSELPLLIVTDRARAPYRNIIVAADFSDASRQALEAAAALFPEQRITVFHAHDAPALYAATDRQSHLEQFRLSAHADYAAFVRSAALADKARARLGVVIEWGNPASLMRELVRTAEADLVVLGTRARGPLLHALVGSVSQKIAASLPCDALVIPERRG
jgi:nucleotide-binding universal stress UspA family protein